MEGRRAELVPLAGPPQLSREQMTRSDALVSGNLVDTISRAAESLPPLHCFGRDRKAASSYNAPSQPARAKGVALAGRRATPSSSANVPVERAFLRGGAREQPTLPSTRAFSSLDLGRPSGTRPSGARDQGSRGTLSGGGGRAALTPPRVAAGRPTRSQTAAAQTAVCPPATPPSATAALRSGSSRAGSASASEAAPSSAPVCLKCDACDGKHATDRCPWFKGKARDKHPDAKRASEKKMLGMQSGPVEVLRHGSARVVRQPGDGSCLFHSLSHGLRDGSSASSLRREVASFISENPGLMISDSPLKDWVRLATPERSTMRPALTRPSSLPARRYCGTPTPP